jgi:hypothetical protein
VSEAAAKAEDGVDRCSSRLLIKGELGGRQQFRSRLGQMLMGACLSSSSGRPSAWSTEAALLLVVDGVEA